MKISKGMSGMYMRNSILEALDDEVELMQSFHPSITDGEVRAKVLRHKKRDMHQYKLETENELNRFAISEVEKQKRWDALRRLYHCDGFNLKFIANVYGELARLENEEGIYEGSYHQLLTTWIQIDELQYLGVEGEKTLDNGFIGLSFRVLKQESRREVKSES